LGPPGLQLLPLEERENKGRGGEEKIREKRRVGTSTVSMGGGEKYLLRDEKSQPPSTWHSAILAGGNEIDYERKKGGGGKGGVGRKDAGNLIDLTGGKGKRRRRRERGHWVTSSLKSLTKKKGKEKRQRKGKLPAAATSYRQLMQVRRGENCKGRRVRGKWCHRVCILGSKKGRTLIKRGKEK